MHPEMGAIEEAQFWPEVVRQRIRSTYLWFGGGLALTAAQTYALFRTGLARVAGVEERGSRGKRGDGRRSEGVARSGAITLGTRMPRVGPRATCPC